MRQQRGEVANNPCPLPQGPEEDGPQQVEGSAHRLAPGDAGESTPHV